MISAALQIGIGSVWMLAAIGKALTPGGTRAAVERLIRGPETAVALIARLAIPVELLLGLMLIARWHARWAAFASIALFLGFAVALGRAGIRDSLIEGGGGHAGGCGCFGGLTRARMIVTPANPHLDTAAAPRAVARNLVLTALAVAAAFGG